MSSVKLKSVEELMQTNLVGYHFSVPAWGMTRTSRHAYDPETWKVLEDDGTSCTVGQVGAHPIYNKKWPKEYTAQQIFQYAIFDSKTSNYLIK